MNKKDNESAISKRIYTSFCLVTKIKVAFLFIFIFVVALLYHFPIKKTLESFLVSQLSNLPGCEISYARMDISFFLPGIVLERPTIQGQCFGQARTRLTLETLNIDLLFPSLFPLGLRFRTEIKARGSLINLRARVSPSSQFMGIAESRITSSLINDLLGLGPLARGSFALEASLETVDNWPREASISLRSEDFSLLKSNIQGISLPQINIGEINLRGNLQEESVRIERVKIGGDNSDVAGYFQGTLNLSRTNPLASRVDMEGRFRLGEKIITAIPLIKLFLQNKETEEGFYRLRLTGDLGAPRPEIL